MPQMSPLMWMFLMIMVIIVYCLFMVINYFIYQTSEMSMSKSKEDIIQKSWWW